MALYTYTIFDANPNSSSGTAWPSHDSIEIEAGNDDEAREMVLDVMSVEAAGLNPSDGYEVGDRLYSLIWGEDEVQLERQPTYELTAEDLGADKSSVGSWDTVASFVQTYPSDGDDGACDVEVQIGETAGVWYMRTRDDAGGSDEADDTSYASEDAAREAAESYAFDANVANPGEDAEDYLRRQTEARAGEPSTDGEWCVYWETALDDSGPRDRYETREQAEAAAELANESLRKHNPGGNLLCSFDVRALVDGEWVPVEP